ncbi:fetal and adult testis-expressed transcript protein isoform X1 [Cricetulus griseus]|uniref:fetal and adult testis-expressed transcript protein isoform X1 n=1 Tax=Cricetulus griseus TaxID=10029 RepID=UPI000454C06B|nr:fetal and adult testis-expressed transcript protein isoform X1 [Cricetulus griseus]
MNQGSSQKQYHLEHYLISKLLTQQKRRRPRDPPTRYSGNSRGELPSVFSVPSTLNNLTNEYLVVMAASSSNVKEGYKMSISEDLGTGNFDQSQEQPVMSEMMERGSRSLGGIQRRPRAEQKPAGSGSGQSFWNVTGPRPKKGGHQVQMPRMPRDHSQVDGYLQDLEADLVAEIGLEILNGLEMEVMRRQMQVISGRLRALEDQDATWRHKEAVLFSLLVSVCIANLWLWMRQ